MKRACWGLAVVCLLAPLGAGAGGATTVAGTAVWYPNPFYPQGEVLSLTVRASVPAASGDVAVYTHGDARLRIDVTCTALATGSFSHTLYASGRGEDGVTYHVTADFPKLELLNTSTRVFFDVLTIADDRPCGGTAFPGWFGTGRFAAT